MLTVCRFGASGVDLASVVGDYDVLVSGNAVGDCVLELAVID